MANPTLVLWCDAAQNRLYKSWLSSQPLEQPQLKQGDSVFVEVHWLSSLGVNGVEEYAFAPSSSVVLAVGLIDAYPASGSFKLTYGTDTTASLAYNISASSLETALNGLASITAEGGVSVEKNGELYRVVWSDPGVRTNQLSANTDELSPSSNAAISELRAGTASLSREIIIGFKQAPIAACTSFSPIPEPTITVDNVLANTWRLSINPTPRSGSYSITFAAGFNTYTTAAIPFNSTIGYVQNALNKLLDSGSNQFSVTSTGQTTIEVNCPSSVKIGGTTLSVGAVTASAALVGFSGITGVLNMNTVQVEEFLAGEMSKNCYLEVEVEQDGVKQTIIQAPVTVINDLISNSVFTLVDMGEVMPVDSVVRYDTSQSLTNGEQVQARTNIGAADSATVSTLANDVSTLQGQFGSISYSVLTNDQKDAITGAATPSATNVFVSTSAQTTALATKAALVHTHTALQISDSTSVGRDLLTATDLAAQKALLGITGGPFAPIASPTFTGTVTIPAGASISGYLTTAVATAAFAARSANLSDLSSASAARGNLGLGTMATATASDYLAKAGNLSGLASVSDAKDNLGLGTSSSPQFTATFFGGTSGNYSTASGTAFSTYATGGQYVTIQPSGITANASNGISVIVPANNDTAKIAKTGQYNGEYGIWYGAAGGNQTGITKNGVRFPDGSLQTTATDSGFNSTLVEALGTSFSAANPNAIWNMDYIPDINDVGIIDATTGSASAAPGWTYDDDDFIYNSTQYDPTTSLTYSQNCMARVLAGQNYIRLITKSKESGYAILEWIATGFLADREVKYNTTPTSTTVWSANQGGSLSNNTLRMDKPWKYSFNVMMYIDLQQPYGSSYSPDAHTGNYQGGEITNLTDNFAAFSFGLFGFINTNGYGQAGTGTYGDYENGGIARFYYNRANGQLLFKYPKSQRGYQGNWPNTWVLPTYGEIGVSLPDPEFLTEAGTLCMDVEITNLATGTLNQDNSNSMKVRLEIYSKNQVSTQVVEFTVNDVVSPIELETGTGTVLCATDALCYPVILSGVRAARTGSSDPYIDIQTSNMKFAYVD